jgi:hypothetical protein
MGPSLPPPSLCNKLAYVPEWFMSAQHCDHEGAVRILPDLEARHALGIHWGTFQPTDEGRDEPARRLNAALAGCGIEAARFRAAVPAVVWEGSLPLSEDRLRRCSRRHCTSMREKNGSAGPGWSCRAACLFSFLATSSVGIRMNTMVPDAVNQLRGDHRLERGAAHNAGRSGMRIQDRITAPSADPSDIRRCGRRVVDSNNVNNIKPVSSRR